MNKNSNNSYTKMDSFEKVKLIPVIIQDFETSEVLMLAFMNKEALHKSLETGYTWFYSRERKRLWNKGETSGNKQQIKEIHYDCDKDALLIKVIQSGVACHTGNKSCFFNEIAIHCSNKEQCLVENSLDFGNYFGIHEKSEEQNHDPLLFLNDLYETVKERVKEKSKNSYTYKLHQKGIQEIVKKVGEESIEIILAVSIQEKRQIIYEISDLLYHLIVLMFEKGISFKEIIDELKSRHKQSSQKIL
ncbi:MAG: bifunctional phosphoribosyl-AMP cyclohydrolase/phosphoribosyl-ATP diphosphatase HisIE [Actinomycetota bacterium]|nr:bifunctional phosphoribosyl-AMP cyclohydrolase/phosphoribosyl-ATP diphosphatase HisIE [Actinomycetota bacterium]